MFRWDDLKEGHVLLGMILSIISCVLLILTTFSTPYIKSIYFLSANEIKYGAFGYCLNDKSTSNCEKHIGFSAVATSGGGGGGGEIEEWATKSAVLFGIAAIFMLLAFITLILSLLKVGKFMWNPIYFRTTALLGSLFAILAEIFALILWVNARRRYDQIDIRAKYGVALWLGLIGTISAFFSVVMGGPAFQGNYIYRAHPGQAYNV